MTTVVVRHKVADYAKWKSAYDSMDSFHKSKGVKSAQIFQSADDPHELIILSEFENITSARQFAQSQELKDGMGKAGVSDQPSVYFVNKVASRSF